MVSMTQSFAHRALFALGLALGASGFGVLIANLLADGGGLVLAAHQWATIAMRGGELASLLAVAFGMLGLASGLAHLRGRHDAILIDPRVFAAMLLILWYAAYNLLLKAKFGDENANQNSITGIFVGDWQPTQVMAVIPGYHWVMAQLSGLFGPSLLWTRTLTFLVSLGALWIYYDLARRWKPDQAGHAVIALALMPIIFPYSAAAYTDGPSTALVLAGLWALTLRRYWWAALLVLAACYVRQSNLVWLGLFPAIAAWHLWQEMRAGPVESRLALWPFLLRVLLPRLYPFPLAVLFFVGSFVVISDSLLWGQVPANRPRPNLGNLFAFVFYAMLFWAPVWLPRARADGAAMGAWVLRRPLAGAAAAAALLLAGLGLFYGYDNFHPWNQPFQFLTNIPLVLMQDSAVLRLLGILVMLWGVLAFGRIWWEQAHRVELALVMAFFGVFLLPHALVDPRYYMVPLALINLFWVYPQARERALLWWWGGWSVFIGLAMIIGHLRYTTISW